MTAKCRDCKYVLIDGDEQYFAQCDLVFPPWMNWVNRDIARRVCIDPTYSDYCDFGVERDEDDE